MVSGRASLELQQKAWVVRIPIVAALSARKFKMTLVGFLRGESCNIYAGPKRLGS
jgi:FdhD protein